MTRPLLLSLLLASCSGDFIEQGPKGGYVYVYSHTTQGGGCGFIHSTSPKVLLRCEPCAVDLTAACEFDGRTVADVYAVPGTGGPAEVSELVYFEPALCSP